MKKMEKLMNKWIACRFSQVHCLHWTELQLQQSFCENTDNKVLPCRSNAGMRKKSLFLFYGEELRLLSRVYQKNFSFHDNWQATQTLQQ